MDSNAMNRLTYGLFVITACDNGYDNGCIINTAMQITANPNRISVTINKANATHDMIIKNKKFIISVINEAADFEMFKRFGFATGREVNKFEGFMDYDRGQNGLIYITKGINTFIEGAVEQTIDLGTHTLFIAAVTDMKVLNDISSATYSYYHENIKPKSNIKTSDSKNKTSWKCKVCGYVHEGEELPKDFLCPICKHPAGDFEKVNGNY